MADEEYARSVAKIVAGQLLAAHGVDSTQRSTLDILADLLLRYIVEVGKQSHVHAELSHRTECNPLDVELALANLGLSVPVLREYAQKLDELPFAGNISKFPLPKSLPLQPTFEQRNESAPSHIPSFLPAFPDEHAHKDTPQFPEADTSAETRQEKLTKQQKDAQEVLLKVQAREAPESKVLQQAVAAIEARVHPSEEEEQPEGAEESMVQREAHNPFLALPIWEAPGPPRSLANRAGRAAPSTTQQPASMDWVSLADAEAREGFSSKFKGFKMGDVLDPHDLLATSGRATEDAYGAEVIDDVGGGGDVRRRRLISTLDASQARAREILSTRGGDEGEATAFVTEALAEEEI